MIHLVNEINKKGNKSRNVVIVRRKVASVSFRRNPVSISRVVSVYEAGGASSHTTAIKSGQTVPLPAHAGYRKGWIISS